MHIFKSKIDKSILGFLLLSFVACLLGASVMIKLGGAVNYVMSACILIFGAGFPLWTMLSTRYIIENGHLKILSGPFSCTIPIETIESIHEVHSITASPALSFDRIEIKYDENRTVTISPDDRSAFLRQLGFGKATNNDQNTSSQANGKARKNKAQKKSKARAQKNTDQN